MFLCEIKDDMQGVIVIKIIRANGIEDIKNNFKRYETLLSFEEIVFDNNDEYVVDVYNAENR